MTHRGDSIPFALKDGRSVDVTEVERGLACGCICPDCKQPLQANNGPIRKFFSHDPGRDHEDCVNARETAIHLMAKQILLECRQFRIPELVITVSLDKNLHKEFSARKSIVQERLVSFDRVELEQRRGEITPDVIAYIGEKELIIEIAVTHFVDREKRDKLRKLYTNVVEVDLSGLSRYPTKNELKSLLLGPDAVKQKDKLKKWISYPPAVKAKAELQAQLEEQYKHYAQEQERKKAQRIATEKARAEMMARRFDLPKFKPLPPRRRYANNGKLNIEYKNKAVRHYYCPSPCGYLVEVPAQSKEDVYCKRCGKKISE